VKHSTRTRLLALAGASGLASVAAAAGAQPIRKDAPPPTPAAPQSADAVTPGKVAFESYALPNGLQVILSEDHSAQVVTVDVWYKVGSRNERPTRTGFAHLFEHMMFQGSQNVKKGEHFQLVERAGGNLNGSTWDDRTNYYENLPSNRLNLGLWLEADRMRSLAVTPANLDNQREAVKEERRMRIDNQPYATAFVDIMPAAFDSTACFGYAHPGIGSMADLNAAQVGDVQAFFKQYYAPNNAVLTVVGDFDPAEAKRLVQQYFGDIPRVEAPAAVACDAKFGSGQVRRRVRDPKANLPALLHVYKVPAYSDADAPVVDLIATILGQGESSRLNQRLARETKAAAGTQALHNARVGPGTLITFAVANQGVPVDSLDRLLAAEVARLTSEGVSEAELAKAKNAFRAGTITERQRTFTVAEALQRANLFLGSPDAVNTDFERYMKVTVSDIRRVAQKYLQPNNSLVLIISNQESVQ
jgi:predicted Zn-dependent peptidase